MLRRDGLIEVMTSKKAAGWVTYIFEGFCDVDKLDCCRFFHKQLCAVL